MSTYSVHKLVNEEKFDAVMMEIGFELKSLWKKEMQDSDISYKLNETPQTQGRILGMTAGKNL